MQSLAYAHLHQHTILVFPDVGKAILLRRALSTGPKGSWFAKHEFTIFYSLRRLGLPLLCYVQLVFCTYANPEHVQVRVSFCMCAESREGYQILCSVILHLIPLRWGFWLNLELSWQPASSVILLSLPCTALGLQMCLATSANLHACWYLNSDISADAASALAHLNSCSHVCFPSLVLTNVQDSHAMSEIVSGPRSSYIREACWRSTHWRICTHCLHTYLR